MEATQKAQAVSKKPKQGFKRTFKGNREVVHDLFRLEPAVYKNNVSYKFYEPKIEEEDHKHYFHSIDKKGKPKQVSSKDIGHYHYITIKADENGNMVTECGPPMRKVVKRIRGKEKTVEEQIFYGAETLEKALVEGGVVDIHTHEVTYLDSEQIKI